MKKVKGTDIIVFLLVMLFVYAAASKLMAFDEFQAQLGKSPLITGFAKILSILVPVVEIVVSLMLLNTPTLLYGLYASFFLMFTFTGYIAFILTFSPYVPCSCGGVLRSMGWTAHLIFNIGFVLLILVGIFFYNRGQREHELLPFS